MTSCKAYPKLLKPLNKQLDRHGIMVRTSAIVDASVTGSPFRPKGKAAYEVATDREEQPRSEEEREKVERTFSSIKRWFQNIKARYRGLAKTHTQHIMEATAYNLYRSPGIVMSGCKE